MNPIDEVRERLSSHPGVKLDEQENFIEATPISDEGFAVSLSNDRIHDTVSYGGAWHEHIESAQEALNCFGFGLSEQCRLKIHRAGHSEHRWTAEHWQDGEWVKISTTGLLVYAFWAKELCLSTEPRHHERAKRRLDIPLMLATARGRYHRIFGLCGDPQRSLTRLQPGAPRL